MIETEQLIPVGRINKPHGLKGEMNISVTDDLFDRVAHCPYLICEVDGIYVPFFIDTYRFRSENSALLKFDGVETQEAALEFAGRDLYFDRRCFSPQEAEEYASAEEEVEEWDEWIGYHIHDAQHGDLGAIVEVDDQTENVLFCVDHGGEELLIPAAEELITEIDDEQQIIYMNLPVGLVDQTEAEIDQ
jgi:16S rRNA processing protein RimM